LLIVLSCLSVPLWLTMLVAVTAPLTGASPTFTSIANGAGLLQLQLWLALVTEQVLRRRDRSNRTAGSRPGVIPGVDRSRATPMRIARCSSRRCGP